MTERAAERRARNVAATLRGSSDGGGGGGGGGGGTELDAPTTASTRKYLHNPECHYADGASAASVGEVPLHPDFGADPVGEYVVLLSIAIDGRVCARGVCRQFITGTSSDRAALPCCSAICSQGALLA
jgi:hypothetical protein